MFKYLFHFLFGYVIIKIEGKNTEQLLNRCARENLRQIRRHGREYASAEIPPKLYHRIKLYARDYGCKISVMRRGGLPFLLLKLKRRKVLLAGFPVVLIVLMWLCTRIWVIDISETDPAKRLKIAEILTDHGIVCGMPGRDLDPYRLQQEILSRHREFIWFGAELHGTRLRVDVRYATPAPDADPTDRVSNLVAKKSGIVEKMVVRRGQAQVSEGMYVTEGQLLVSGITQVNDYGNLYVYADGDVLARTNRTITETAPLTLWERIKTGEVTKKYCITLFGKDFNLFFKPPGYTHYDGEIIEKRLKFFGEYFLPASLRIYCYNEVKPTPKTRSAEEVRALLEQRLTLQLEQTAKDIRSVNFDADISDESVTVTLRAECVENIAEDAPITFEKKPFLRENITPEAIKKTEE